jgi:hypothetical protein
MLEDLLKSDLERLAGRVARLVDAGHLDLGRRPPALTVFLSSFLHVFPMLGGAWPGEVEGLPALRTRHSIQIGSRP